jgi:hypothetical protein
MDRAEMIHAQQLEQAARIDLVTFVVSFIEAFFRGSHTKSVVTCGFNKSYNQAAQVPSSNVTCGSPRSPCTN